MTKINNKDTKLVRENRYRKYFVVGLLFLLIISSIGFGIYYFNKYEGVDGADLNTDPKSLIASVSKLYQLPTDEMPTIATVSDVEKLSDQIFFKQAQNGDKVLIYKNAKKAILFRPTTNKIIEIGPVVGDIKSEESLVTNQVESSSTSASIKVAIYNGTAKVGLTKKLEGDLLKISSVKFEIVQKTNAKLNNYDKSVIYKLNDKADVNGLSQLKTLSKAEVTDMPEGEVKPANADYLVILGNNY